MTNYLEQLAVRLAVAMAELDEETRTRHIQWLRQQQRDDGGFGGRAGGSDLYYTGFALRSLSMLGQLHGEIAERAADYLRDKLHAQQTIVDFLSLIYAAFLLDMSAGIDVFTQADDRWQDYVAGELEKLRLDDGGYAKGPEGRASSTYHTFLVTICLELLERKPPDVASLVRFVHSQAADDGGFREIRAGKRAGTNPTAAAIATLKIFAGVTDDICEETIDFLADMQTDEGGLRANTRIPIADLLSSFTGLLTLFDLGGENEIELHRLRRYARSLEINSGGFLAAAWDEIPDVEYTFYGLGVLALCGQGT